MSSLYTRGTSEFRHELSVKVHRVATAFFAVVLSVCRFVLLPFVCRESSKREREAWKIATVIRGLVCICQDEDLFFECGIYPMLFSELLIRLYGSENSERIGNREISFLFCFRSPDGPFPEPCWLTQKRPSTHRLLHLVRRRKRRDQVKQHQDQSVGTRIPYFFPTGWSSPVPTHGFSFSTKRMALWRSERPLLLQNEVVSFSSSHI